MFLCREKCWSKVDVKLLNEVKFWVCGVLFLVFGSLGIIGNILSISFLLQRYVGINICTFYPATLRSMATVFNHLLTFLCMADLLLLSGILLEAPVALGLQV